jgi:hypothetical protein
MCVTFKLHIFGTKLQIQPSALRWTTKSFQSPVRSDLNACAPEC